MKKIFLNLGCGNRVEPKTCSPESKENIKWINIDFENDKADIKMDLRNPLPFEMNSVDFIYSSHLVEHFTAYEWAAIRKDWYRALCPGGILEIHCPDLEAACRLFLKGENKYTGIVSIHNMIYGSQEVIGQMHHQGFDKDRIMKDLEFEGFRIELCYNTTGGDDWELTCIAVK